MSNKPHVLLAGLVVASAFLSGGEALARNSYCCNDSSGRLVCGDMIPAACQKRAYTIRDGRGRVVREVEAPLTPEQRQLREAETARKKEQEKRLAEQKRLDAALLATYPNEKDIDTVRNRSLADFDKASGDSQKRLEAALKRKKKLDNEKEFYLKKPMPANLKRQIEDTDNEIKTLQESIDSRKADRDALNAKFDQDKKRYMDLRYGASRRAADPTLPAAAGGDATPAPPAPLLKAPKPRKPDPAPTAR